LWLGRLSFGIVALRNWRGRWSSVAQSDSGAILLIPVSAWLIAASRGVIAAFRDRRLASPPHATKLSRQKWKHCLRWSRPPFCLLSLAPRTAQTARKRPRTSSCSSWCDAQDDKARRSWLISSRH